MANGRKKKYATPEERKAAMKAYQAAYQQMRRDGTWKRKNRVRTADGRLVHEDELHAENPSTPEERRRLEERRKEREARRKELERLSKEKEARRVAREERRRQIIEKYGFDPAVVRTRPLTAEEAEARHRLMLDQEAEYRRRHHDHITTYNREYRRKRLAAELAARQKTWTAEEWAEWRRCQEAKFTGPGTPAWMVHEVVRLLAGEEGIPEDAVLEKLLAGGGVEFILKGAEALGRIRAARPSMVTAAARAVCLFLDPEHAVLCKPLVPRKRKKSEKRSEENGVGE